MSQNVNVGTVSLKTTLDRTGFNSQMANFQTSVSSQMKKIGLAVGSIMSVRALYNFGKDCTELGSDLAEVQNVVDVTFSTMNEKVNQFAKDAKTSFGLSETMAKKYAGTLGSMASGFDFSEKQAYEMATTLTGLIGDVASFRNIDQDVAFTKLKAVFSGETEGLKDLGVVMTQTALDQYALSNGFGKTTSQMTEQEKVLLRYQFVLDQLKNDIGDYSRTSNSWANQIRNLSLSIDTLKANIGQGLINVLNNALPYINKFIDNLNVLAESFKNATEGIFGAAEGTNTNTSNSFYDISSEIEGIGTNAEESQKKVERFVAGFDKLNKVSSSSNSSDTEENKEITTDLNKTNTNLKETEKQTEKISNKFDKMMQSLKDYINSMKNWGTFLKQFGKDYLEYYLLPLANFSISENGLPRLLDIMTKFNNNVDFGKINEGFKNIFIYSEKFNEIGWDYLMDFCELFLEPIAEWAMNNLVPVVLDLIAESLELIGQVLKALNPLWEFLLKIGEGIAELAGDVLVSVLTILLNILKGITDWISEHETAFSNILTFLVAFFAAFKGINLIIKAATRISEFMYITNRLGAALWAAKTSITAIISAMNPWTLVIAAVVAGLVVLALNWDTVKEYALNAINAAKDALINLKDGAIAKFEELKNWWSTTPQWMQDIGNSIYNNITAPFSSLLEFFSNLWNEIQTMSENGTLTIGNVIKAVLINALNSMIGYIETVINSAISLINGITGVFSTVSDFKIGKLDNFNLPRFADGGFVPAQGTNGGVLGMWGDIPQSKGGEYALREDQLKGLLEENSINTARALSSINNTSNNNYQQPIILKLEEEVIGKAMINIANNKRAICGNSVI